MTKAVIQSNIFKTSGGLDIAGGANIEIRDSETGSFAQLWTDRAGTTLTTNPFNADVNGFFRVYANPSRVNITATIGAEVQTLKDIVIDDGIPEINEWSAVETYDKYKMVYYNGNLYTSKTDAHIGATTPDVDTTNWKVYDGSFNSMPELLANASIFADGQVVYLSAFHDGINTGLEYRVNKSGDLTLHNGGTYIDTTNTADITTWDSAAQTAWFTAGTGTGVLLEAVYEGNIMASWFGAKADNSTDDKQPIDAAIAYAKTYVQRGSTPILSGAFPLVVATLEFDHAIYVYSGTMDFTNVYEYCNLYCSGMATFRHTGDSVTNPICLDIGNGADVDVTGMRIENIGFVRGTRDVGSIGIRSNGAHGTHFKNLFIWGFEAGIDQYGSEFTTYDFGRSGIGSCTWAVRFQTLVTPAPTTWKPNILTIRGLWTYDGCDVGVFAKQNPSSAAGSGGVIKVEDALFQGISNTGTAAIIENSGEVSGAGTVVFDNCWWEGSGVVYLDLTNSNAVIRNSFIFANATASGSHYIVKLNDKTSTVKFENVEGYFDVSAPVLNNAIVNRADGTVDGMVTQIDAMRGMNIVNGAGSNVKLFNSTAPITNFVSGRKNAYSVNLTTAYPAGNVDNFSNGLVLNLHQLVTDMIGSLLPTPCHVDIVMAGSDGSAAVGRAWIRGYYRGGVGVNWTPVDLAAGQPYALSAAGTGTSYAITFPTGSHPEWLNTQVAITVTTYE